jgi:hypothetical protein
MLNFLRKRYAKIQKNSRPVGEDTTLTAAAAWKSLKFVSISAAAARLYLFLISGGGGFADLLTPLVERLW